jgi:hypothetical protein
LEDKQGKETAVLSLLGLWLVLAERAVRSWMESEWVKEDGRDFAVWVNVVM